MFKLFAAASTETAKSSTKADFTSWDWAIMVFYLVGMMGIGVFFYIQERMNKNKNSESYLTAKGLKVPSIVIGLSIWATGLSSITFLALPGLAFRTGWLWMVGPLAFLGVAPLLIKWVIPFYRRIQESTAYAYLQKRFSYIIRAIASASFILFHIFRMAIVLYIPALTLSLFVSINIYLILFLVAIVVVLGTFLGGFKGVLWTDTVQGVIFLIGIVLIILFGLIQTDWNNPDTKLQQIFRPSHFHVSLASGGMIFIFVARYIETLFTFMASQDIVQRYKTGKTVSKVYKSIYINVVLAIITVLVFFGVGSVLYSYFSSQYDVDAADAIDKIVGIKGAANNQLLSFFIINVLPAGISGLIIAAVFAASQSTISSSLNSLVNAIIVDFVGKLPKKFKDKTILIASKILIVGFGLFGMLVSFLIALTQQQDLIIYFLNIVALLGGPLAGLFILGIGTKRTNWVGTLIGVTTALLTAVILFVFSSSFMPKHLKITFAAEWLLILSFVLTLTLSYGISYIISMFTQKFQTKNITNLTIWTRTNEFKELVALEKKIAKSEKFVKKNKMPKSELDQMILQYEKLDKIVESQTS